MGWVPPHNNFTTFVKDDNDIYIKCADGSWVVITLRPNPIGPYGGGGGRHQYTYKFIEQKWEILGKRAVQGDINSKIIGKPGELHVFGVKLIGEKAEEVRNVFTVRGNIAVFDELQLSFFGAEAEYLEKSFYTLGYKAERDLKNVPVFGSKGEEKKTEYIFNGVKTTDEVIDLLVCGFNAENTGKLDLMLAGKIGEMSFVDGLIKGNKGLFDKVEKGLTGQKSFKALLNLLLTNI